MTNKLDLLNEFVHGELEWETIESANELKTVGTDLYGFAQNSEAYNVANDLNIPIQELQSKEKQGDLFHTPVKRYDIDHSKYYDLVPFRFGGDELVNETDEDGYARPFAYDDTDVLFECPRGMCMISRTKWSEGWRSCPGC